MKLFNLLVDLQSRFRTTSRLSFLLILFSLFFFIPTNALAAPCTSVPSFDCTQGCTDIGDCVNQRSCVITGSQVAPVGSACEGNAGAKVIGPINPPKGVALYNIQAVAPGTPSIGILRFISNALKFFAVLCGLLVFFNILYAGYEYITGAGKTDVHVKVRERLTWSLIGLILLIAAYMIAALIGLFIFGDPTFLLNPDLTKYGALAP